MNKYLPTIKTKNMNKINLHRLKYCFVFFLTLLSLIACDKDKDITSPTGQGGGSGTAISYSYGNPLNIKITAPYTNHIDQESVTENYIYYKLMHNGNTIKINRTPIGSNFPITLTSSYIPSSVVPTGWALSGAFYKYTNSNIPVTNDGLFCIDDSETNLYMLAPIVEVIRPNHYYQLIKWNMTTGQVMKFFSDFSNSLDGLKNVEKKCMRIGLDGNIYIASLAFNGSIIKINSTSAAISIVANNLINPGYFDFYNGSLFVPINTASSGKVIKIDQNNIITDILVNLTGPTNVAIDNYGSILVRSQTTIDGGNYHKYDLFKIDGGIIGNVRDASGISILSNTYENTPMTFDSFNNLYFYHADGVVVGGITYNNPVGQKGLFKMGIIKN